MCFRQPSCHSQMDLRKTKMDQNKGNLIDVLYRAAKCYRSITAASLHFNVIQIWDSDLQAAFATQNVIRGFAPLNGGVFGKTPVLPPWGN